MKFLCHKFYILGILTCSIVITTACSTKEKRATLVVESLQEINRSIDVPTCPLKKGLDLDQKTIGQIIYCCAGACASTATFFIGYSCKNLLNATHQKTE